jgi:hypothetical protein
MSSTIPITPVTQFIQLTPLILHSSDIESIIATPHPRSLDGNCIRASTLSTPSLLLNRQTISVLSRTQEHAVPGIASAYCAIVTPLSVPRSCFRVSLPVVLSSPAYPAYPSKASFNLSRKPTLRDCCRSLCRCHFSSHRPISTKNRSTIYPAGYRVFGVRKSTGSLVSSVMEITNANADVADFPATLTRAVAGYGWGS